MRVTPPGVDAIAAWMRDARERTLALVEDLTDEQLLVPRMPIVNPLGWEVGHVAWFQERWTLRHLGGKAPLLAEADSLFDSEKVAHDTRWDLPLPSRSEILGYLHAVQDGVLRQLEERPLDERASYFNLLAVFHEDMHGEAFLMTRQVASHPATVACGATASACDRDAVLLGDLRIPGGRIRLGAEPGAHVFVFDNEKWAHDVELAPFAIALSAVSQAEFAAFVDDGGYERVAWWTDAGALWRDSVGAKHPVYWRRAPSGWERRDFHRFVPLEPHQPVVHVNRFEAEAYCRYAGRRLPTEAEWEMAAKLEPTTGGERRLPWSHVWEWTASDFLPYPGFSADPYAAYSQPWFATHAVLRGGSWCTRPRLIRPTFRNFYEPQRRDPFAGFRTCALEARGQVG